MITRSKKRWNENSQFRSTKRRNNFRGQAGVGPGSRKLRRKDYIRLQGQGPRLPRLSCRREALESRVATFPRTDVTSARGTFRSRYRFENCLSNANVGKQKGASEIEGIENAKEEEEKR